ncbi:RNA polymerase sigma factor [Psychroflexus sediminis]|uniref:RNA polymerase sigma-70 factor, ECF subfamily n=1 Tax=Psychroflexus sediminis TaxID=470826 RepID=A0A1G7VSE6_9FLAO|nr:RNA polymerase sigma-70 factor [Psychroflexus sediminis]SDG62725.1 RNA polymerase sigma-70 factor, ECF subfamily [Psychroflexus sediminis]
MEDSVFIEKLKTGDEIAYKILYEKYYEWLCNYVFRLCENKKLSEDIVQDMLMKFYQKREHINITSSLKNYLFTSCHNQFLQHLRKKKICFDDLDAIKWEVIASSVNPQELPQKDRLKQLHQLIDELPARCKEIFIKSKLENTKYKDIAIDMDISVKTVENQMSKALKHLRKRANLFAL